MKVETVNRRFLFVCTTERPPEERPACGAKGMDVLLALRAYLDRTDAWSEIEVVPCGCLGCCEEGAVVLDPARGTMWTGVGPADADALLGRVLAFSPEDGWTSTT